MQTKLKRALKPSLLVVLMLGMAACDYESSTSPEVRACTYSEMEVKSLLKAPSSAKFPACSQMSISNSGNVYTVSSTVEAQNSFGVMIETLFSCEVTLNTDDSYYIDCTLY